jgi:hypothetical protein
VNPAGRAGALLFTAAVAACGPSDPCRTSHFQRVSEWSRSYAGRWVVARGDTLTLPDGMGDRFRLTELQLDTVRTIAGPACRLRGALVFGVPRVETLAVTWLGEPEHATIFGWPADLGPFAGIEIRWWGRDSLQGAILFDERLGVRMAPGVTARFVAGRAPPALSFVRHRRSPRP